MKTSVAANCEQLYAICIIGAKFLRMRKVHINHCQYQNNKRESTNVHFGLCLTFICVFCFPFDFLGIIWKDCATECTTNETTDNTQTKKIYRFHLTWICSFVTCLWLVECKRKTKKTNEIHLSVFMLSLLIVSNEIKSYTSPRSSLIDPTSIIINVSQSHSFVCLFSLFDSFYCYTVVMPHCDS